VPVIFLKRLGRVDRIYIYMSIQLLSAKPGYKRWLHVILLVTAYLPIHECQTISVKLYIYSGHTRATNCRRGSVYRTRKPGLSNYMKRFAGASCSRCAFVMVV